MPVGDDPNRRSPATAVEARRVLADCFPDFADRPLTLVESGLDNLVLDVGGEWIVRLPRRATVEVHLAAEVALLAELADVLSVPVPRPELCADGHVRAVRHRKLPGVRLDAHLDGPHRSALAGRLGHFLGELHRFSASRVMELGVRAYDPPSWLEQWHIFYAEARRRVFPLLDAFERRRATELIESFPAGDPHVRFTLMHGDLKPEHVLCSAGGLITGVIDWTDARIGDPAVDLAWPVHGTDSEFGGAVLGHYPGNDPALVERARVYYRIAPWHELIFGVQTGRAELVESGLAGLRQRLG